ncbi:MAG: archaellin/type IV pilin N-terminal domain-containing protein [archaeon]
MNKRGLSPVIATVLLIGIVVVIGLIIFLWFRGLTEEAVVKFDENIQLVCNDVDFDGSYSSGTNTLTVSNNGNVPIFSMKIKILHSSGDYETQDVGSSWPTEGLDIGRVFTGILTGVSGDDEIILVPVLRGSKQNGGESTYTCDENNYGRQI